jgi:hypothetical protein
MIVLVRPHLFSTIEGFLMELAESAVSGAKREVSMANVNALFTILVRAWLRFKKPQVSGSRRFPSGKPSQARHCLKEFDVASPRTDPDGQRKYSAIINEISKTKEPSRVRTVVGKFRQRRNLSNLSPGTRFLNCHRPVGTREFIARNARRRSRFLSVQQLPRLPQQFRNKRQVRQARKEDTKIAVSRRPLRRRHGSNAQAIQRAVSEGIPPHHQLRARRRLARKRPRQLMPPRRLARRHHPRVLQRLQRTIAGESGIKTRIIPD